MAHITLVHFAEHLPIFTLFSFTTVTAGTFGKVFLAQRLADENGDAEVGGGNPKLPRKLKRFERGKTHFQVIQSVTFLSPSYLEVDPSNL